MLRQYIRKGERTGHYRAGNQLYRSIMAPAPPRPPPGHAASGTQDTPIAGVSLWSLRYGLDLGLGQAPRGVCAE
jgi:hypothetical protein